MYQQSYMYQLLQHCYKYHCVHVHTMCFNHTINTIKTMAATSIHLLPCKESSEIHNKREKDLDYVRKDMTPYNEQFIMEPDLGTLRAKIAETVKEKTGRKMQKKAEPLREGVLVIDENTTIEQIQEIGRRFHEEFGVTLVQAYIHRDEGRWVDENGNRAFIGNNDKPREGYEWRANMHAHLVFNWYDMETGKSVKTSKADASRMQDICAEVLAMERGVSSDKKHIKAAEYKAKKMLEDAEEVSSGYKDWLEFVTDMDKSVSELTEKQIALTAEVSRLECEKNDLGASIQAGMDVEEILPDIRYTMKQMNSLKLDSRQKAELFENRELEVEKVWEDPATGIQIPKTRVGLSVLHWEVLMNGRKIVDWFRDKITQLRKAFGLEHVRDGQLLISEQTTAIQERLGLPKAKESGPTFDMRTNRVGVWVKGRGEVKEYACTLTPDEARDIKHTQSQDEMRLKLWQSIERHASHPMRDTRPNQEQSQRSTMKR